MWLLIAQVPDKLLPSAGEVAGWTPSQTIQTLLVMTLVAVGIAACFGMRALFKSNDTTITMLSDRFKIQDERQSKMEDRHAVQQDKMHAVMGELSVSLRSLSDSVGRQTR